jgi:uncharacterized UPF0160 family protein
MAENEEIEFPITPLENNIIHELLNKFLTKKEDISEIDKFFNNTINFITDDIKKFINDFQEKINENIKISVKINIQQELLGINNDIQINNESIKQIEESIRERTQLILMEKAMKELKKKRKRYSLSKICNARRFMEN